MHLMLKLKRQIHCCDVNEDYNLCCGLSGEHGAVNHHFHLLQLREQMLTKITRVILNSPNNTTQEVEVTARAVAGLTQRPDELSPAAQVQCSRSVQQYQKIFQITSF